MRLIELNLLIRTGGCSCIQIRSCCNYINMPLDRWMDGSWIDRNNLEILALNAEELDLKLEDRIWTDKSTGTASAI